MQYIIEVNDYDLDKLPDFIKDLPKQPLFMYPYKYAYFINDEQQRLFLKLAHPEIEIYEETL